MFLDQLITVSLFFTIVGLFEVENMPWNSSPWSITMKFTPIWSTQLKFPVRSCRLIFNRLTFLVEFLAVVYFAFEVETFATDFFFHRSVHCWKFGSQFFVLYLLIFRHFDRKNFKYAFFIVKLLLQDWLSSSIVPMESVAYIDFYKVGSHASSPSQNQVTGLQQINQW